MAVVGLGGVGCPAAQILVRSGVGHVHCVDRDVVDRSNLNRQLLFTDADLGKPKAEVGVRRLREQNPTVEVTGEVLDVDGVGPLRALAERFDVVLLAADRPRDIRSWTNQACLTTGTPWVHGGYHGPLISLGAFRPGRGACFDCGPADEAARSRGLPEPTEWAHGVDVAQPNAADATNCVLAGVFAARFALSLRTGVPDLPTPFHLEFNLVTMREHVVEALDAPSLHCPTCGPGAASSR
jgi:molybdopterin-synthase adenylyltransferase